ncbi:Gfo/Idh/MocA family oxidoreductase [Anaerolineales bacterium HSG25]|nr:Gfo/Idh/MocA family oxidoreductase [Anaerolineales bacterium HSG25]
MNNILKYAVIGVGSMGNNHARILSDMPGVDLVAVVDANGQRAKQIARRYNTRAYTTSEALFEQEKLDIVNICVPTVKHHKIALQAAGHGVNFLVEKPIAISIEQGQEIVNAAKEANIIMTVGHVERFNPAVIELHKRVEAGELGQVFQIQAHRASPFPAHVLDVGVVTDLAVHDLDVMRYITQSEVQRVYAETAQRIHTSHEDQLIGILRFEAGMIGKLTVNWLTPTKIRQLSVLGERGKFIVNYLTQELTFYENGATESSDWLGVLQGIKPGRMIGYVIHRQEPLRAELESFIQAVRDGTTPVVTGHDGIQALALAEAVIQAGQSHQTVTM